jgi:site-specific DNA-methyltransferase (adenine-specific)
MRSKARLAAYGEIWTPPHIVREMHNLLPDDVWLDPTLIYLEPSCGNGAFLVDIAQHRLSLGLKPLQVARNTFGVDLLRDNVQEARARLTKILGYPDIINKNLITADFMDWVKKAKKAFSEAFGYKGKEMPKTNNLVVFGNPPYQSEDGGGMSESSSKPIYHLFVEAVIDNLNPRYFSFIIPSRWMAGGRGLDNHRNRMMKDRHFRSIKHFPGENDVFKDTTLKGGIKGGVNYFLWDKNYSGKCNFNGTHRYLDEYDIIVLDNQSVSILDKVMASHASNFLDSKCLSQKPFGLRSDFKDWKETGIPCYSRGKTKKFVDSTCFTDKNNVQGLWKVCMSKGINPNSEGRFEVYNQLFLAEPNSICLETYLVINAFDSKIEAENFITYMKTRFFRFILGLRLVTQNVCKDSFAFVPDFGDYSKPVTDADLYKRFGLTPEEIAYIESKIKSFPRPVS